MLSDVLLGPGPPGAGRYAHAREYNVRAFASGGAVSQRCSAHAYELGECECVECYRGIRACWVGVQCVACVVCVSGILSSLVDHSAPCLQSSGVHPLGTARLNGSPLADHLGRPMKQTPLNKPAQSPSKKAPPV